MRRLARVRQTLHVPCLRAVVCFGVPCCALLCCAALLRAVLCCPLPCFAMSCLAVLWRVEPCCAVLSRVMPCCAVSRNAVPRCAALCCAVLWCALLYCIVSSCAVYCCAVLCDGSIAAPDPVWDCGGDGQTGGSAVWVAGGPCGLGVFGWSVAGGRGLLWCGLAGPCCGESGFAVWSNTLGGCPWGCPPLAPAPLSPAL